MLQIIWTRLDNSSAVEVRLKLLGFSWQLVDFDRGGQYKKVAEEGHIIRDNFTYSVYQYNKK